jgi:hypothetical protein
MKYVYLFSTDRNAVGIELYFHYLRRLLRFFNLRDAGFVRLVLCALRAILFPILALVRFRFILFFTSMALKHWAGLETILPLRWPDVHLYLRTT